MNKALRKTTRSIAKRSPARKIFGKALGKKQPRGLLGALAKKGMSQSKGGFFSRLKRATAQKAQPKGIFGALARRAGQKAQPKGILGGLFGGG